MKQGAVLGRYKECWLYFFLFLVNVNVTSLVIGRYYKTTLSFTHYSLLGQGSVLSDVMFSNHVYLV